MQRRYVWRGTRVRNLLATAADLDYLRGWAQPLGVAVLLEECLREP